ncbi:MAG: ATP-binding cassette domain-containing protein, partial [Cryobacterium sp.]
MRAVVGTRWLGVVILLSLAGSGVILITRLSDPDDALLHLLLTQLPVAATAGAATPLLSAVLGVGLGLATAHRGGWVDQTMRTLVITGLGLCVGWAVLLGGFWFALHIELTPMLADERTALARIGLLSTLLLPATAVLLGAALAISVHVRSAARAVSLEGFVRTARLRGLPITGMVLRRVLRRTLPAMLTVLAAELIVVYCGALIVQAVYTRATLPADLLLLPAGSLPVVLGCAVAAVIGILIVALATATGWGLAPVDGWRPGAGGRGDDPVPATSMPSTGFRSADLLDIRDLRIHQVPEQPWAEEPGTAGPDDSINLTVARGEAVAIIGDHSSGTGQLCRAIVGLLPLRTPVRSGSILFDGRELVGLPEREFRRLRGAQIGILDSPSSHRLDPRVRVGKTLTGILAARPGASRSGARAAALQLLSRVGVDTVEDVFTAYPHQ